MDCDFFCIHVLYARRLDGVAPPTALGTEEWSASPRPIGTGRSQLHEVKVRAVCER
jgi:hypothetical protein